MIFVGNTAIQREQESSRNDYFNNIRIGESKDGFDPSLQKEDTLWTVFHRLKAVLETPPHDTSPVGMNLSESGNNPRSSRSGRHSGRVHHEVIYDDSKRVVDMTEIQPNLFIGDE